jgi:general L-amino acid transport system permease protein
MWFVFVALRGLFAWAFFSANWEPVTGSLKLFALGQYPQEDMWRPGMIVLMASFLMGVSWRVWGGTVRTFALALAVALGVVAALPVEMRLPLRLWFVANPALVGLGYLVGRSPVVRSRWVLLGWILSFVATIILLNGFKGVSWLPKVDTAMWGGLLLTFLLALVGIVASFPIGVLLALGRRSSLPVVKVFCVLFIELVRGVPLVTILFTGSIILPLFLPDGVRIDRVLRAMMAMTLFAAAYMAENVRGGLQAIPLGQVEAAKAVGLNGFQTMALIVLPQALRAVIPAIVGQFIALFMDTTLAVIIGLVELLGVGKAILNSKPEWLLLDTEVYVFIGALFWVFTYSMSYASRRLEAALGVGER